MRVRVWVSAYECKLVRVYLPLRLVPIFRGMEAHATYGTFLLSKQPSDGDREEVMIRHRTHTPLLALDIPGTGVDSADCADDGKAFKSDEQRKQLGLPPRTRRGTEGTSNSVYASQAGRIIGSAAAQIPDSDGIDADGPARTDAEHQRSDNALRNTEDEGKAVKLGHK
jgi:hypothetical protein